MSDPSPNSADPDEPRLTPRSATMTRNDLSGDLLPPPPRDPQTSKVSDGGRPLVSGVGWDGKVWRVGPIAWRCVNKLWSSWVCLAAWMGEGFGFGLG
eukprot:1362430-Amorphochlora_amoeboformis.AAC.1